MDRTASRWTGVLTDLGYLLMGGWPQLQRPYRRWARRRYRRLAPGYRDHVRHDPAYLAALRAVLPRLPAAPRLVVEVGAGTGAATVLLAQIYRMATIIAVDLSTAMLAQFVPSAGHAHRIVADAAALPLHSGRADLVLVHNAPFHLEEMRRVASPAGVIAVILSSGGRLPPALRRRLAARFATAAWGVEEHTEGEGIALIFRRRPTPAIPPAGAARGAAR